MNINIIKKITNTKTNFSVLSMVKVEGNKAIASNMEEFCTMDLRHEMDTGLYYFDNFKLGYDGIPTKPDINNMSDFPDIPNCYFVEPHCILKKEHLKLIMKTVSTDRSQYTLNGFLYEGNSLVSVDGRRMTKIDISGDKMKNPSIIKSFPKIVSDIPDIVDLYLHEEKAFFKSPTGSFGTTCLAGKFPNYNMFIPESTKHSLNIEFSILKKIIKRLIPFIDKESNKMVLHINTNNCYITVSNPDIRTPVFEMESKCDTQTILSLNAKILLPILENENCFLFNTPNVPIQINGEFKGNKILKIIMPMKMELDVPETPFIFEEAIQMKSGGFL